MQKKSIYTFDNTSSTGLDKVPANSLIHIKDSDGTGTAKYITITSKTGIDNTTTINTLLTTMSANWESELVTKEEMEVAYADWELIATGVSLTSADYDNYPAMNNYRFIRLIVEYPSFGGTGLGWVSTRFYIRHDYIGGEKYIRTYENHTEDSWWVKGYLYHSSKSNYYSCFFYKMDGTTASSATGIITDIHGSNVMSIL